MNTVQQQDVHVVGWFDSVVLRHSRRVSGITDLSINSIDVLTGLDTVKICTAYELDGEEITEYPANLDHYVVVNQSLKSYQDGKKISLVAVH